MKVFLDIEEILRSSQCVTNIIQLSQITKLTYHQVMYYITILTLNGEIKQGSITQRLSKELEDMTKEHLDLMFNRNEEG